MYFLLLLFLNYLKTNVDLQPTHDVDATGFEDVSDYQYVYQVIQDKSLADCVEALIGAFFQSTGVNGCLNFMNDVLEIPVMFKNVLASGGKLTLFCYLTFCALLRGLMVQ